MRKLFAALLFSAASLPVLAQGLAGTNIHGNFELNAQYYRPDSAIGAPEVPEKFLNNGFMNLIYEKDNFSAGLRYESYRNPLLGFERDYSGSGFPYRFVSFKKDELEITAGNFYDQFGNGLVFRSYEERGLGLDNAMDGLRVKYTPYKGITFKGVVGVQRDYFSLGKGIVRGGDVEWNINESCSKMDSAKTTYILGASFVSKYQEDDDNTYILPQNVGAGSGRFNIIHGGWNLGGEFAYKANDPSYSNGYIYKDGSAALLTLNYSQSGFGFSLGAKRIDNFSFRSDRTAILNSLMINYLPAMTKQHTNILASLYPYATQPTGEYGFQGEVFFHLKNGFLAGSRGADVAVNYSRAQDIDRVPTADPDQGYTSDFLKLGKEVYYEDFNIEYTHKVSKSVKMILTYAYIHYNKDVIEGRPGFGHIYSHIGIAEINWKIDTHHNLRTELQHLYTMQDDKSWALLLAEYTISPHWFFAGFSEYNYANDNEDRRFNYYNVSFGYTQNANRISLGYGRQRAGLFCVGGVCRTVPASNGISISITSSF